MGKTPVFRSLGVICQLLILLSPIVVLSQTVTISVLPQPASQVREGRVLFLRCRVRDFDESSMSMSWAGLLGGFSQPRILTKESTIYRGEINDLSYTARTNEATADELEHTLIINPARTNHSGTYFCRVMQTVIFNSAVVAAEQVDVAVYPSRVFPSCSPNGTAEVTVGSPLFCTVNTSYSSAFIMKSRGDAHENWNRRELSQGVNLTSSVSVTDDGQTYNCSSFPDNYPGVFTCQIGPLSVPSPPTTLAPSPDNTSKPTTESEAPAVSASPEITPTPEGSATTLQPTTVTGVLVSVPTSSDSAPTKPEDEVANPPASVEGGDKPSKTPDNSPDEPRQPVTSRALTAILVILVIAVFLIIVVAMVMERRKSKPASENSNQTMEYHKVDAEKA